MHSSRTVAALAVLLVIAALPVGCASTNLTSSYVNDDWAGGPFHRLVVIGLTDNPGGRAFYEDVLSQRLEAAGVQAIESAKVMPNHGTLERDLVARWIRQEGVDGVLVTHVVDVERETEVVPPTYYPTLYGYYGWRWGGISASPGYVRQNTIVRLETNLYDARTGQLVWSGSSETFNPESRESIAREVAELVVESLQERELLPGEG